MSSINAGKVIAGGLVAGVVLNALDFANNYLLVGDDFRANSTRLGLDPAALESTTAIASKRVRRTTRTTIATAWSTSMGR